MIHALTPNPVKVKVVLSAILLPTPYPARRVLQGAPFSAFLLSLYRVLPTSHYECISILILSSLAWGEDQSREEALEI